jgi:hypothetical protein
MGYEKLEADLAAFDALIATQQIKWPAASPVVDQFELTRQFLSDKRDLAEADWLAKWNPRFKEFYNAQLVVSRLVEAVAVLASTQAQRLRSYLKIILPGDLTQGTDPTQAKDFFYELWLAAILAQSGFLVVLAEPDIVISGNGLGKPLGIACKYPSSEQQVHPHLSKGYKQIGKQSLDGLVAIGLDLLVYRKAFPNGMNYIDFRQGDRHPLEVVQQMVGEATVHLVESRPVLYPSEAPVDGLLTTLTVGGIIGSPASLAFVTAVTLQSDSQNPITSDLGIVYRAMWQKTN